MPVNRPNAGTINASWVSLNAEFEALYWTDRFEVTREEIVEVTTKVGHRVIDVIGELARRHALAHPSS